MLKAVSNFGIRINQRIYLMLVKLLKDQRIGYPK
jgi:hypothetical protein